MSPHDLEDLLCRAAITPADAMVALVEALDGETQQQLELELRERLETLPVPVGGRTSGAFATQRFKAEQLLGALESIFGDPSRLLEASRREWIHGGSHAVYLRVLARHGDRDHAVRMALAILEQPSLSEPELETVVGGVLHLPVGFRSAVHSLSEAPTAEGFRALLRFAPIERREEHATYALRVLASLGVEHEQLFPLAVGEGLMQSAIELAESGDVPASLAASCVELGGLPRSRVLGLAARAAAVRGEDFCAVRFLREARSEGARPDELEQDLSFVRLHATVELELMLARAGLTRPRAPIYG